MRARREGSAASPHEARALSPFSGRGEANGLSNLQPGGRAGMGLARRYFLILGRRERWGTQHLSRKAGEKGKEAGGLFPESSKALGYRMNSW